jgi:hypothetical protein
LLVVAALAAVAFLAAMDTLRQDAETPSASTEASATASTRQVRTSDRGASTPFSGLLVYADRRCRVFAIGLTALEPHVPSGTRSCRFRFAPGNRLSFGPEIPSPRGAVSARCVHGAVKLLSRRAVLGRVSGCAPAWKPDGTLTVVDDGEAVAFTSDCLRIRDRCGQIVSLGGRLGKAPLVAVTWLSNTDAATILEPAAARNVVAIFEGGRLEARSRSFRRLSALRASPTGRYVAARSTGPAGVVVFDRGLRSWSFLGHARAIAWSPDESFAAVATPAGIKIAGADALETQLFGLGFRAIDVAWR